MIVGRVAELWWYPVKSFLGQRAERLDVTPEGIPGDRALALADAHTGRVLSAKRVHRLLEGRTDGERMILPSGRTLTADDPGAEDALSGWLGRPVVIVRAPGSGDARREMEGEEDSIYRGQPGGLHDSSPLHLVTTATLAHLRALYPGGDYDPRRFRPNIVVDTGDAEGPVEQSWVGRDITIGDAQMAVLKTCHRCVITTLPQSDLSHDPRILRTVNDLEDGETGVYLRAATEARIQIGDPLIL